MAMAQAPYYMINMSGRTHMMNMSGGTQMVVIPSMPAQMLQQHTYLPQTMQLRARSPLCQRLEDVLCCIMRCGDRQCAQDACCIIEKMLPQLQAYCGGSSVRVAMRGSAIDTSAVPEEDEYQNEE